MQRLSRTFAATLPNVVANDVLTGDAATVAGLAWTLRLYGTEMLPTDTLVLAISTHATPQSMGLSDGTLTPAELIRVLRPVHAHLLLVLNTPSAESFRSVVDAGAGRAALFAAPAGGASDGEAMIDAFGRALRDRVGRTPNDGIDASALADRVLRSAPSVVRDATTARFFGPTRDLWSSTFDATSPMLELGGREPDPREARQLASRAHRGGDPAQLTAFR